MKADKRTIQIIKHFINNQEGWNLKDLISDIVVETGLLKHITMNDYNLSPDECVIEWDGDEICLLEDFINKYTEIFIEKISNVLDSFKNEDFKK
jgi:hypothetical protein